MSDPVADTPSVPATPLSIPPSTKSFRKSEVGDLRPSQALTTFGIGSLIDLPNLSVLVLGLDDWQPSRAEEISEERLLLSVQRVLGGQVTKLLTPPRAPESVGGGGLSNWFDDSHTTGIPVAPFPRWLVCSGCRLLAPISSGLFEPKVEPFMSPSVMGQKIEEILRYCKQIVLTHQEPQNESVPKPTLPAVTPGIVGENFWDWKLSDVIQIFMAFVTFLVLLYSIKSYNLADDTRKKQLRAYVTATSLKLDDPVLHVAVDAYFKVVFKNSGLTPATRLHVRTTAVAITGGGCKIKSSSDPVAVSEGQIASGDTFENIGGGFRLDRECFDALRFGQATMRFSGIIDYKDIFDEDHQDTFCFVNMPLVKAFVFCPPDVEIDASGGKRNH